MSFNVYQHRIKNEILLIVLLFFISVAIRVPIIIIFGDTNLENEWATLFNNLINHGVLAIHNFDGFLLPNLWMPPLYAYYIYIFSFFNLDYSNFVLLILLSQAFLASISVVVFYKINRFFFSKNISLFSSLLFSIFPLYVYAAAQISSISLNIFLSLLFYYYFFQITKKKNIHSIIIFSFIAGLLILTRREFIVILILSSIFLFIFFNISKKNILLIFLISTITVSPYLVRNFLIFERVIIQAGFGYNVWKANNPNSKVEGSLVIDENLKKKIKKIPKNKFYRIEEDKIFLKEGVGYIIENPKRYIILYLKKISALLFFDLNSSEPNYYNPLHYIPVLILGITSIAGIFVSPKKNHQFNYLILIFFFYIMTFAFFAVLPRYKLVIVPLQIIFTNILLDYIKKKKLFSKLI